VEFDRLLPGAIRTGNVEQRRRARLLAWGVAISSLVATLALLMLYVLDLGAAERMPIVLGTVVLMPVSLLLLWLTHSVPVATTALICTCFGGIVLGFVSGSEFAVLAMLAMPILSTHLVGRMAGACWTAVAILWLVAIGLGPSPAHHHDGYLWSTVILVLAFGIAAAVIETMRARAVSELGVAEARLEREQQRLRTFVGSAFPLFAEVTRERVLDVSDGAERLLGWSREEVVRGPVRQRVHPEDWPAFISRLSTPKPFRAELRALHADGHWRWLEVFAIPADGDGRWLVGARDFEDDRQRRERMQHAERMQSVGTLAAGIAHDFNNLLTVIMGFGSLLPEGRVRHEIERAAGDAAQLTRQLLSFARPQAASLALLDPGALAGDLEPLLRSVAGEAIDVQIARAPERLTIMAAASQVSQVLLNLVSNARDAMPQGGRLRVAIDRADIRAGAAPSGEGLPVADGAYVRLAVSDNGFGMDEATRARALQPFFTTKAQRGSGLGLASVDSIATQAGGCVQVRSSPGDGTTVTVYWPLQAGTAAATGKAPEPAPVAPGTRVLVVEDDASVRETVAGMLRGAGYVVSEASSGEAALATLDAQPDACDVIVSDVVMPGMQGHELVHALRTRSRRTRVLLISGYTDARRDDWPRDAGVAFLAKPFQPATLLSRVAALLAA
jgi:PAS domain S-box-containing protein